LTADIVRIFPRGLIKYEAVLLLHKILVANQLRLMLTLVRGVNNVFENLFKFPSIYAPLALALKT
jgi:hypothetical protein